MRFQSIADLQQAVIRCPLSKCPYRSEAPDYYPKPPRGPHTSKVMLGSVRWSDSLKHMPDDKRLQIAGGRIYAVLPHPDGLWRNPPMPRDQYEAAISYD